MTKISDLQKMAVIMLMGSNRLLKMSIALNEHVGISIATEQVNISKEILGDEIFNDLIDKLDGKTPSDLAEEVTKQTHDFVQLFQEEEIENDQEF
jgi:hypothetical protein